MSEAKFQRSLYQVRPEATRNHLVRSTSGSLIWHGWSLCWKMDSMCSASASTGMGLVTLKTTYEVPESGFIFTSRKRAKEEHLHYHAIYAHVKRQAPRFLDYLKKSGQKWGPEVAKLRPHSGRATLITELMGEGLSTALSMKYASLALISSDCLQRNVTTWRTTLNLGKVPVWWYEVPFPSLDSYHHWRIAIDLGFARTLFNAAAMVTWFSNG